MSWQTQAFTRLRRRQIIYFVSYTVDIKAKGNVDGASAPGPETNGSGASQALATFAALDQDGNGVVTLSELLALADEGGVALSDEQVRQILAAVDADRSGSFDMDEWLKVLAVDDTLDGVAIEACVGDGCVITLLQEIVDQLAG